MLEPAGRVKEPAAWTIASQTIPQYVVAVPNAQDAPDCVVETISYSVSSECPVAATDFIFVAVAPEIAPTVSVTDVYPPNIAKTKSFTLFVDTPDTVGAEVVEVHPDTPLFGTLAFVSKG